MQPTKEEIKLAKPCYEALGIISKGKWQWQPKVGEWFLSTKLNEMVDEETSNKGSILQFLDDEKEKQ